MKKLSKQVDLAIKNAEAAATPAEKKAWERELDRLVMQEVTAWAR